MNTENTKKEFCQNNVQKKIVRNFVKPKATSWKFLLPPINEQDSVLFFVTDTEDACSNFPLCTGRTFFLCPSIEIAKSIKNEFIKTEHSNNIFLVVSSAIDIPFQDKSFDFIISRNFSEIWDKNRNNGKILCKNLYSLLSQSGTALISKKDKPVCDINSYIRNLIRSFAKADYKFNHIVKSHFNAVQCIFYCMPDHNSFDEIINSEWLQDRPNKSLPLRQKAKELIFTYMFPHGSPSTNYILQARALPSLLHLILNRFCDFFAETSQNLKVHRILIGNPNTIICMLSLGSKKYILRIPMTSEALARAERQWETLCHLQASFGEDVRRSGLPLVYQPVEICGQKIFTEEKFDGIVIEDPTCLNKTAEKNAVRWLIEFHIATQQIVENTASYLHALVDVPFKKLSSNLRTEQERDELSFLQEQTIQRLKSIKFKAVCMHGDYKIENMTFSNQNYEVSGVFDWDLSNLFGLPVVDLLYFIAYNDQLTNQKKYITEIYFDKFILQNISKLESQFIDSYMKMLEIETSYVKYFSIIAWIFDITHRTPAELLNSDRFYSKNIQSYLPDTCKILKNSI